jgi:pyruvate dehydrogenase E2 component (dihydrolipoamide acetyltransferase)
MPLDGDQLVYKQYYNIGFAADTPNGLVVPVIKDADKKGILQISPRWANWPRRRATASSARPTCRAASCRSARWAASAARTSRPSSTLPEVAILGLSKGQMKPVWDGKQFQPRLMLPLSLSWDHRVIDGARRRASTPTWARCWRTTAESSKKKRDLDDHRSGSEEGRADRDRSGLPW